MSDALFDADAHDPNHWRFYGRRAFLAECAAVIRDGPGAMVISDVHAKALANLKSRAAPQPKEGKTE